MVEVIEIQKMLISFAGKSTIAQGKNTNRSEGYRTSKMLDVLLNVSTNAQ